MGSHNIIIRIGGFLGGLVSKTSLGKGGSRDSGTRKVESRHAGMFGIVKSLIPGDVSIHYGNEDGILVDADENIVPLIRTEVIGDVLMISSVGSFSTQQPIKVSVAIHSDREMPDLDLVGSGDMAMHGIDKAELAVSLQGSGDIAISGRAGRISLSLKGSGDIDARRLRSDEADISLAGSGDIEASATEKVSIKLTGSGDVTVVGSPKKVNSSNHGSGDVSIR